MTILFIMDSQELEFNFFVVFETRKKVHHHYIYFKKWWWWWALQIMNNLFCYYSQKIIHYLILLLCLIHLSLYNLMKITMVNLKMRIIMDFKATGKRRKFAKNREKFIIDYLSSISQFNFCFCMKNLKIWLDGIVIHI